MNDSNFTQSRVAVLIPNNFLLLQNPVGISPLMSEWAWLIGKCQVYIHQLNESHYNTVSPIVTKAKVPFNYNKLNWLKCNYRQIGFIVRGITLIDTCLAEWSSC